MIWILRPLFYLQRCTPSMLLFEAVGVYEVVPHVLLLIDGVKDELEQLAESLLVHVALLTLFGCLEVHVRKVHSHRLVGEVCHELF